MDCLTRADYPCVIDASGCVNCPEIPGSPAKPAKLSVTADVGWDAGANSIDVFEGDCHTTFSLADYVACAVVGLKYARTFPMDPTGVDYGLIFRPDPGGLDGLNLFVIENGVEVVGLGTVLLEDVFTIARVGSTILYVWNMGLAWTSEVPSAGPLLVNSCLYATGDAIA